MNCRQLLVSLLFVVGSLTFHAAQAEEVVQLQAYNGESLSFSVLSYEQADEFFKYVQKQRNIPHGLIADGCHVRAQQMSDLAAYKKIQAAKLVIEADGDDKLIIRSEDGPWLARWDYHIAPVVMVQTESGIEPYVIDPALFDGPADRFQWLGKILKDTPQSAQNSAQIYFVSRFTFTPSVKDQVYTSLPAKLDRSMGGMLSIFSANLRTMGAFYEKCYLENPETKEETIGGVPRSEVPGGEDFQKCEPAGA